MDNCFTVFNYFYQKFQSLIFYIKHIVTIPEPENQRKLFSLLTSLFSLLTLLISLISGCAGTPNVSHIRHDICEIFRENPKWYQSAYRSSRKWGIPIPVIMAVMYHESGFRAKAKPPRTTCLFIFPGPRPSSAYGYAQAIDETWKKYKKATGNWGADRDDFTDAADFIGWYCHISRIQCNIPGYDAYNLYLAYHEGQKGFLQQTYKRKKWLKQVAANVNQRTEIYSQQLASCEREFQKAEGGCCLMPF